MNVLKIVIVSFLFVKLFAFNLYVPENYNLTLKEVNIKKYKSLKDIDFNTSLALISYNELPFILDKNLIIITPIGKVNEYILSHKQDLSEIKTIANLDFATEVLLSRVNNDYKEKGSLKEFLNNKIDAVVHNKKIEKTGIFNFPLMLYGIEFNKYFIVGDKRFIKLNREKIKHLNVIFENSFDFRKDLVYKTLVLSSFYLNKNVDFNQILFENYILQDKSNDEYLEVDVTKNWHPFHIFENGHIYGMGIDFWRLIAKKAHLKYRMNIVNSWSDVLRDIKEKKADLTIDTSFTPYRENYALFSKPYISFPLAIICKNNKSFKSINDIKSIAVGRNYTAESLMKKHYPNLNYIETTDAFAALELVKHNEVNCAVDILPVMMWLINKNHFLNLQLAFKTPFKFDVKIMIRQDRPDILEKVNNAIDKITPIERDKIINKYIYPVIIQHQQKTSYKYSLLIAIVIFLILIFFLIRKNRKISKEAMYDKLTGLLNRRGIDVHIKDISEGSILFFDIDHFKKINDTYGHKFGDYVLKELGKILREYFRKSDLVGRWGGEEFMVVLPDTDYENAIKVAEKLREIVGNYNFKNVQVTISIGVSEYHGNLEEAMIKADMALYEAKKSGRNRVKGKR